MTARAEVIAQIVANAHEHGIEPYELLGGAIAESNLDPDAWRQGEWPDWSAGLFQQTVLYADEGDHTASAENVALIRRLYSDIGHACDVAARQYLYWRHNPDVPPLTAWVAYNGPSFYHTPEESPNIENYRRALAEAQAILGADPMPVTYNRAEPAIAQNDPWSCSCTSTRWALTALGRHPGEAWIEAQMKADGIVTEADGLLIADGGPLAAWITKEYGEYGYYANNEPRGRVTFDGLAAEFRATNNPYPGLIGGTAWGHWSGLRTYDPTRDLLLLANPADGYKGVGQTMNRQQFAALGPFSLVRVLHGDLLGTPPAAPPPVPPAPTWRDELDGIIRQLTDLRDRVPV